MALECILLKHYIFFYFHSNISIFFSWLVFIPAEVKIMVRWLLNACACACLCACVFISPGKAAHGLAELHAHANKSPNHWWCMQFEDSIIFTSKGFLCLFMATRDYCNKKKRICLQFGMRDILLHGVQEYSSVKTLWELWGSCEELWCVFLAVSQIKHTFSQFL